MYTVTTVLERPTSNISWYMETAEGKLAIDKWNKICPASVSLTRSSDDLTATIVYEYESKAAYSTFLSTYQQELLDIKVKRDAYHKANGITRILTVA